MKKKKVFILCLVSYFAAIGLGCSTMVPVRVIDYSTQLGGKNVKVVLTQTYTPISIDGTTITGISPEANRFSTAVIYTNENGKTVTGYSNLNQVSAGHVEMIDTNKKYVKLDIARYFFKEGSALTSCITMGASGQTLISESVHMTVPASMYSPNDYFSEQFIKGKPIDMLIVVQNNGTIDVKDVIHVVDVVPDFLKIQSASYFGNVQKVGYDIHDKGKSQIAAFKIYPNNNGLKRNKFVMLKISAVPDMNKLKMPYYEYK